MINGAVASTHYINGLSVCYVVVDGDTMSQYLGDYAVVKDTVTGKSVKCIVAETGNKNDKLGFLEISWAAIVSLGFGDVASPGNFPKSLEKDGRYELLIRGNTAKNESWNKVVTQQDIDSWIPTRSI